MDINLFHVFDTIYQEGNLTRAAASLHLTQPAVSNALRRLRKTFGDELFVRVGHQMVPTPLARRMIQPVREGLRQLAYGALMREKFDPAKARDTFRFSMGDLAEMMILPGLVPALANLAPDVALQCHLVPRRDLVRELTSGKLDFAVDDPAYSHPELENQRLAKDHYELVVRTGHPLVQGPPDLDTFLRLSHILVSRRREGAGHVDLALSRLGLKRRVALRTAHYLTALQLVESSDLVLTLPAGLATRFGLHGYPLPFEIPGIEFHLFWHPAVGEAPRHRWMRELIFARIT